MSMHFELQSSFEPAGDQPQAIADICSWFEAWKNIQTLLGATGTGKTFTMAHIIQKLQKPTLILSHNKTLAAQLATEFKHFFPKNAVHYFVSYFDYYQPESYLADRDMYIEKEATINEEIQMYRLGALASLLSRPDTIIISSVSALYGLGKKEFFAENTLKLYVGESYDFTDIKRSLITMQYKPVQSKIEQWMFEMRGEMIDIYSSIEKKLYRLMFNEDELEHIQVIHPMTFQPQGQLDSLTIWPGTQYLQDMTNVEWILQEMQKECDERYAFLMKTGNMLEAERIKKRVEYDIRMIRETWFVNGIENYSLYFDKRHPGQAPNTLFDYYPDDFLCILDESHMTVPQLQAMPKADRSRKNNLINHGFRLPSAMDHRPLNFHELEWLVGRTDTKTSNEAMNHSDLDYFEERLGVSWDAMKKAHYTDLHERSKKASKTLFVSATPAKYEAAHSQQVVEQIIRPTGLLDPITYVYPKSGDYQTLIDSIDILWKQKPETKKLFEKE